VNQNHRKKADNSSHQKSAKTLENLAETYRKIGPYLNIGTVWAVSVLFFTWIGWYLDKKWMTQPWLTVLGAFIGIITGFYHFLKTVLDDKSKNESEKK
jgi:F0F1-type ATP synthase assembly protein I